MLDPKFQLTLPFFSPATQEEHAANMREIDRWQRNLTLGDSMWESGAYPFPPPAGTNDLHPITTPTSMSVTTTDTITLQSNNGTIQLLANSITQFIELNSANAIFLDANGKIAIQNTLTVPGTVSDYPSDLGGVRIRATGSDYREGDIDIIASRNVIIDADATILKKNPEPPAPPSGYAALYVRDNGAGKGQLVVRFPTGAPQVLATEP